VLIKDRWWELRLKNARSGGQRATYERIVSGAAAGELSLCSVPAGTQPGKVSDRDPGAHPVIVCRMVAWLSRDQAEGAESLKLEPPSQARLLDPGDYPLANLDIRDLREAIRANLVSFPSQVPTFIKHERPDVQRRLAQLYFVLGWDCGTIGARYELVSARVRQILNTWARRAVETGYIQHIPPVGVLGEWARVAESLRPVATADQDLAPQLSALRRRVRLDARQADLVNRT
jgi:hypothetical protein